MMKDTYIVHVLQVIKANKGIWSLLSAGFTYSQIARFIIWAIDDELITKDKKEILHITKKGMNLIEKTNKKLSRRGMEGWISPAEEPTNQRGLYDIYIPVRRIKS